MPDYCDRNASDDLLTLFLKDYKINLLSLPRQTLDVATLFIRKRDGGVITCRISDVFAKKPGDFGVRVGELGPKIDRTYSGKLDTRAGLSVVDKVFQAFGMHVGAKLAAAYKTAETTRIRITEATEDVAESGLVAKYLTQSGLRPDQTLFVEGDDLFVAMSVVRARGIEITARDSGGQELNINVKAAGLGDASAGVSATSMGVSEVRYTGKTPLAFGVRLLKIVWPEQGSARLETVKDPMKYAGEVVADDDYQLLSEVNVFVNTGN